MAYNILNWKDHAVTPDKTFRVVENSDGTITLVPAGRVIQQGTNMSAANFNNIELGVHAANISASEALRMISLLQNKTTALEGLVIEETLTNDRSYPFNNSTKTIALGKMNERLNKNYTVLVEARAEGGGFVGDIVITDKMLNGFKIAHTGSAKTVKIKCYMQGGK